MKRTFGYELDKRAFVSDMLDEQSYLENGVISTRQISDSYNLNISSDGSYHDISISHRANWDENLCIMKLSVESEDVIGQIMNHVDRSLDVIAVHDS